MNLPQGTDEAPSLVARWYVLIMTVCVYTLSIADRYVMSTVLEPIRLHVQAKRYLVTTDPRHAAALPPAASAALALQGGRMSRDEVWLFEDTPYAEQSVALRRWDDAAHVPGKPTPLLAGFIELLCQVRLDVGGAPRAGIGPADMR